MRLQSVISLCLRHEEMQKIRDRRVGQRHGMHARLEKGGRWLLESWHPILNQTPNAVFKQQIAVLNGWNNHRENNLISITLTCHHRTIGNAKRNKSDPLTSRLSEDLFSFNLHDPRRRRHLLSYLHLVYRRFIVL